MPWHRKLTLLFTGAILLAMVSFVAWDIVSYHRQRPKLPDRTFTVNEVHHTEAGCAKGCWPNQSTVVHRGESMTYEHHKVRNGDRCTTQGQSTEILRCTRDGDKLPLWKGEKPE